MVETGQMANTKGHRPMFKIETLIDGQWESEAVGTDNQFESRQEALDTIEELKTIGADWSMAEYRVVEIED